jgi:hypothetical protein
MVESSTIHEWLEPAKDALEILKAAAPFLPKGRKHDELNTKVKAAEASLAEVMR